MFINLGQIVDIIRNTFDKYLDEALDLVFFVLHHLIHILRIFLLLMEHEAQVFHQIILV